MLDCDTVERAGWTKLLGKYWARILIREAQDKRMEGLPWSSIPMEWGWCLQRNKEEKKTERAQEIHTR